jgi:hypothetical protein
MKVGLTYTQMKLGRAKEHLDALNLEVAKFLQNPYTVTQQDDIEKSEHVLRIEQNVTPDKVGVLVGEFAYSLRSGLDQLAWQLALLSVDDPTKNTCFPIFTTNPVDDRFRKVVWDIPCRAVEIIKSLQPYHARDAFKVHPLWQLNALCNLDKHRLVAISCHAFKIWTNLPILRRRDSNIVVEVRIPLAEKENFQFKVHDPEIIFGEPIVKYDAISEFEVTLDGLTGIYNFVRYEVVPRFEDFFI